jgi:hypothetical protein
MYFMKKRLLIVILPFMALQTIQAATITITTGTNWSIAEHAALYTNDTVIISGCTVTLGADTNYGTLGTYYFQELILTNNAIVICTGQKVSPYDESARGVCLQASNMTIHSGSKIHADGQGFTNASGPGAGTSGGKGGSHGGKGGQQLGKIYGSATAPLCLGSGGFYSSSPGGGAIQLMTAGLLLLNGTISANGLQNYTGGSGGSIWIITGTFTGSGFIEARGGYCSGINGGGGGGRVRVQYDSSSFSGSYSVNGGTGTTTPGWPGTLSIPDGENLRVNYNIALAPGVYNIPHLIVTNSAMLHCQGDTNSTFGSGVTINCQTVQVFSGASISARQEGFPHTAGPGAGSNGGSHGGYGGGSAPKRYGSVTQPTALGSGGYYSGSFGGGAITIHATNLVFIDGTVEANGVQSYCGGSGGSIWITTDVLSGNGLISADGANGDSNLNGGGGGGRVAVDYESSSFTGSYSVKGGASYKIATPGTLSLPDGGDLTVKYSLAFAPGTYHIPHLIVTNGASFYLQGDTNSTYGSGVTLHCQTARVCAGSSISSYMEGFPMRQGPGAGATEALGGNHGGRGGWNAGSLYNSSNHPVALGSGGYVGPGGGAIHLCVSNVLRIDGAIRSDGVSGYGGGAGGSIWIETPLLEGTGTCSAVGGDGSPGGGGGGGRISLTGLKKTFSGSASFSGGAGGAIGGTGTLYKFFLAPERVFLRSPVNCPDEGPPGAAGDNLAQYGRTLNPHPSLLWYIPTNTGSTSLHFTVCYDLTNGSLRQADSAMDPDGFFYRGGAQWLPFPPEGILTTDTTFQVKYVPPLDIIDPTASTAVYWVVNGVAAGVEGTPSLASRFIVGGRSWTDDPLTGHITRIRTLHVSELREEVNYARALRGLPAVVWTDDPLTPNTTRIRDDHLMELRRAMEEAATNVTDETTATNWTDHPIIPLVTPIRTNHVMELRQALGEI